MFGDYSISDLGAILAMQGLAGLILFSVYVLKIGRASCRERV